MKSVRRFLTAEGWVVETTDWDSDLTEVVLERFDGAEEVIA